MRFLRFHVNRREGLAIMDGQMAHGVFSDESAYPGPLVSILAGGQDVLLHAAEHLRKGHDLDMERISFLPPLGQSGKFMCLGLNYHNHAAESGLNSPPHPTVFARFTSSLIGHNANLIRPRASKRFDYEGELVAVIGKHGRHISADNALEYVGGYSIFNDASVRDYQLETSQWTVGKNFDSTGAIGPFLVTPDELPPGGAGLRLQTKLNGQVLQDASTGDMIHNVADTIAFLSQAMTLDPGDILAMGTPSGVGMARNPEVYMKAGDICEVEIERIGVLRNTVVDEI